MDDELKALETELRSLRPAPVPDRLWRRVAAALDEAPARPAPIADLRWLWSVALPAAAAAALMIWQPGVRPPAGEPLALGGGVATLRPVAAENVLVRARDEGFVTLDDGTTARRERFVFLDTITWSNPRTNVSLTWTVPREEVRVVPVSFQ